MTFNSGYYWNLSKSYYSEATNAGAGKYNTYSDFVSGVRSDSTLKDFEYTNPFNFSPTYGSSVAISFVNSLSELGDGYTKIHPSLTNNISFEMSLNFSDRSDSQTSEIYSYIKDVGSHGYFPYQIEPKSSLSGPNAYKSLYSIPPYFVQEFRCSSISNSTRYMDNNETQLGFINNNISQLTAHNILDLPSLPAELRAIISEETNSTNFNIKPSYTISNDTALRDSSFGSEKSREIFGKDGINYAPRLFELSFDGINDEKLLRILAFMISKRGMDRFDYEMPVPYRDSSLPKQKFICKEINHTYVFKGVHDVRCRLFEVF